MKEVNLIGKRVKLTGGHPHAGKSGTVISWDKFVGIGQGYKVKLDDGTDTTVFERSNIELEAAKE